MSHYETLDVLPTASADEIQAAYRSKVDFHLDTSDPPVKLLEKIRVAAHVLGDEELRKAYDRKLEREIAASNANALAAHVERLHRDALTQHEKTSRKMM